MSARPNNHRFRGQPTFPNPRMQHTTGMQRGECYPPHYQERRNQPQANPGQTSAPLKITLTVDPEQLAPRQHQHDQFAPSQHQYDQFAPSQHQYDQFEPRQHQYDQFAPRQHQYDQFAPRQHQYDQFAPRQRYNGPGYDMHPSQSQPFHGRPSPMDPPPYARGTYAPGHPSDRPLMYEDPPPYHPFQNDMRSADYRSDLQSRSLSKPEVTSQRGRGRGKFQGKSMKSSCSMSNLSEDMPLGCEAEGYHKNKSRGKVNHNQARNDHDDDDSCSVQSMPAGTRGHKNFRGAGRGGRSDRRGYRGAGRRGGHSTRGRSPKPYQASDYGSEDLIRDPDEKIVESDTASIQSMPNSTTKFSRRGGKHDMKGDRGGNIKRRQQPPTTNDSSYVGACDSDIGTCTTKAAGFSKPETKDSGNTRQRTQRNKSGKNAPKTPAAVVDLEPLTKKLEVSLRIKSLFDDIDTLKSTVENAFRFPEKWKFKVAFTSETLMYKANLSNCCFILWTNNIGIAHGCVKRMVNILRKTLKTFVYFSINQDGKENGSENGDQVMKKKEATQNIEKDKKEETAAVKDKEIMKQKPKLQVGDKKCPVTYNLSAKKSFANAEGFTSFLTSLIDGLSSVQNFEIEEKSMILSKTSSKCDIHFQSKADAKRLKKVLDRFGKETMLEIDLLRNDVEETEIDETKKQAWKSRGAAILAEMEGKKNDILRKHDEKITLYRSKIDGMKSGLGEEEKQEKDAIEDKLMEATRQKMEFLSMCVRLNSRIQGMNPVTAKDHDLIKVQQNFGIECRRLTSALPIYARREDIISHVKSNQVSIILGETGSGKSTQLTQYLYEAGYGTDGIIVCTQPRKVAAVQLAERVAQELTSRAGDLVGFKAGNKRRVSDKTRIVFMTDHSLLNECLEARYFDKYSCIIVDEAHERSIYTDILLGMIKDCLPRRPDLRVIITSATIDPQVFIDYFKCEEELRVSGRTYPVEVVYLDSTDDFENYESKAIDKAAQIHKNEPAGDILVFLSSPIEIMRCCEEFSKKFQGRDDFKCLPLHGQLSSEDQKKAFVKLDEGVRKVVFSTNCAETSITIDGIKYVIDTGVAKEMRYDAKKNLNLLGVHIISQSSADQRKGRAGRTASGRCYRLFSEEGYKGMTSTNDPEILRVHLGQAVLKLAELGVNISDYDFVKAPSDFALSAALETLGYLGAIVNKKITDVGRWISKLPFDPKLGYLVFEASKSHLLYDSVVLASVVSNGSGMFYRGLTETEAQISARSKAQFGSESGDIFTWYAVYKLWEALPGKEKYKWCRSNCINYKCLNFVRQCVDDVIHVMSNDMKLAVVKEFSNEDSSSKILSKLVFKANALSLCHFMGHTKAGYFPLFSERQVHLHPSCTLVAQNLQPEWVVFTEQVKTSREFIKGISVVKEEWVQEAVDTGQLDVDIARVKEKTLSVVHSEKLGPSAFRALVGPRFSHLQVLENVCEEHGMQHTILEADKDLGNLAIYSSTPVHPEVVKQLNEVKAEVVRKLQTEERECRIFDNGSNDSPNIRAVLGNGGCVKQVMMPDQTNQVLIRKVGLRTEEDILLKFGEFGNIVNAISFKATEPWGFICYGSVADAVKAVESTQKDETMSGSLRLDKKFKSAKNMFEARVSWLRRPVKGQGTAFIKCSPMEKPDLIGRDIYINGASHRIMLSKNKRENDDQVTEGDQDLIIFKIGNATEAEIKDQIQQLTARTFEMKITISRLQVPATSPSELEELKATLKSHIDPKNEENFNLWISKPRNESVFHTAFLSFPDPVKGLHICKRLNGKILINSQIVKISPSIKTTILVNKRIKDACEEQMNELFSSMKKDLGIELEWKKLKEDHGIIIKSDYPEGIVKARECITKELQGDVIDCNMAELCQCLLTKAGQHELRKIQESVGCVIISDIRTQKIHLYGQSAKVSHAKIEINTFLMQNGSGKVQLFDLKGFTKPPGMMKEMMTKFGPLLEGLREEYGLSSISLDWKTHMLKCSGSESAMEGLQKYLVDLEDNLSKVKRAGKYGNNMPECVVCMDSVESREHMYRLEACGHAYCTHCLRHQSVVCVQSNQFPLVCAEELCGTKLVWKDIRFITGKKWITQNKLTKSALNFCVSTQPDKYKFCPTPNCPVVYEVTLDETGCEFNCPACFATTCTSCHIAFHAGLSCNMAKGMAVAERELTKWCSDDPGKRKMCPGCKRPIEKIEGCNKMHCTSCHTVFCWLCSQVFVDEQKCYAHLAKEHGGMY